MDHFVSNQPYFVLGNNDIENPSDDDLDLSSSSSPAIGGGILTLCAIIVIQSAIIFLIRLT